MDQPMNISKSNETTKLLNKLNTIGFLFGVKDIWITDIKLSRRLIYFYNKVEYVIDIINVFFVMSVLGSFFTQNDLTDKQVTDRLIFSIVFPGNIIIYYISLFYKQRNKNLLYQLAIVLKKRQNDADLEREMIKKIKVLSMSLLGLIWTVVVLYGLCALYRVVTAGENFITITTAWPDVHDKSTAAGVMRLFSYCWWFLFTTRVMATFVIVVTKMLAICYQFKNLQIYFYSLDDIFSDVTLSQVEKEMKCKKQHEHVSKEMFATEIIVFFSMLLTQLVTLLAGDRNLAQLFTIIIMSIATCLSLGLFMWNGGDITIEASKLSEAMYSSGWQNCYGQSSVRIRKLVVNAMRQAQDPVVYKTLGVVEFSYESYVTLVKMPYTAVSVFY